MLNDLWSNIKGLIFCVFAVSDKEKRNNGVCQVFEDILAK